MAVVTTGCGSAPSTIGSGIRLDNELVLTAAHVVAGADGVAVVDAADLLPERTWPDFSSAALFDDGVPATLVALELGTDLALLAVDPQISNEVDLPRPDLVIADADAPVSIHGVAGRDPVDGVVAERTTIVADQVRGSERVRRDGYRLTATTAEGDSGAGVWTADERLTGLIFAVSSADDSRTWAVSAREIATILRKHEEEATPLFRCDEETSRLTAAS